MSQRARHLVWSLTACLLAAPPAGATEAADPVAAPAPLVDTGRQLFAQNCSHCHGFNMVTPGTSAPDLRHFQGDKLQFFSTVASGKNNKMPAWADLLNGDDISALWAYVQSRHSP